MYHFAARYYDPNIGRFTTPDPSGQEENPYLYADGDPVNRIDPTGLIDWGGVAAVALGTAVGITATVVLTPVAGAAAPYIGFALGGCVAPRRRPQTPELGRVSRELSALLAVPSVQWEEAGQGRS
ncbi:RHS repeat-associated core domain-containing protein [Streptomyces californicus]|uniref:RHS repeat-associated core domain-containing protein n=1 Tax=Streptomyces californicus TaxID=67351 RepID=UPI003825250C